MTIVAKLKALLHLDNAQYKEGMKDAAGQTVTFKRSLQATNNELRGAKTTAAGLAAIFRGDLLSGVTLLTRGLTGMGSAAASAIGKLGLIAGVATAAYQAGKWLNEKTGLGDRVATMFGPKGEDAVTAAGASQQKARHLANIEAEKEATKIAAGNQKARLELLEGETKLTAKYATEAMEISAAIQQSSNRKFREAMEERLVILAAAHQKELAEIKRKQAEQAEAARRANVAGLAGDVMKQIGYEKTTDELRAGAAESKKSLGERFEERKASIQGKGIRSDSMAQMGGFVGSQRGGMAMADRAMRIAQEDLKVKKEIIRIETDLKQALMEAAEAWASSNSTFR